jgi:IS605 OrfB family transposase
MRLLLTIKAKVFNPTKGKRDGLEALWRSWKGALRLPRDYKTLRGRPVLPSYYCREMAWKIPTGADTSVGLPKDCFNLRAGGPFAPWFISIPTPKGRLRLPLRMAAKHARLLKEALEQTEEAEIWDSHLTRSDKDFFVHLVVAKEVPDPVIPSHGVLLAVDIGERVIATSVALVDGSPCEPRFHGREVRGIRRHYAWLRRRLGERKLLRVVRRMEDTEHRKVEDRLHKASRAIVEMAQASGAVLIALGDLSGIRNGGGRGKRFNRIVNNMPFHRLSSLVEYKAAWEGIPVLRVREDYTSRECRLCHEWGRRPSQGLFLCPICGQYNADLNGAVNIGKRALAYMAIAGAPGFGPERRATFSEPPRCLTGQSVPIEQTEPIALTKWCDAPWPLWSAVTFGRP